MSLRPRSEASLSKIAASLVMNGLTTYWWAYEGTVEYLYQNINQCLLKEALVT